MGAPLFYSWRVEIVSALCRRLRDKAISETDFQMAKGRLHDLLERAYEVGAIVKK